MTSSKRGLNIKPSLTVTESPSTSLPTRYRFQPSFNDMSEPSQDPNPPKSDPPQKPNPTKSDPPKKLQARTAGAPTTNEDVFRMEDFPGAEPGAANTPPGEEEKIGITEALRMKGIKDLAKAARRKSGQIFTMFGGKKDGDKKYEDKNDGSKDGGSNTNTA
jgi:hypothetical protein